MPFRLNKLLEALAVTAGVWLSVCCRQALFAVCLNNRGLDAPGIELFGKTAGEVICSSAEVHGTRGHIRAGTAAVIGPSF